MSKNNLLSSEIANLKSGISLGIASDGLIYIFVNGTPVGNGIPQGQSGDVFGYVDENKTIVLNGTLADGTYTVKYEMSNGSIVNVGNMVLDSTVYYSITNTLTKCTSSNSIKTIAEGSSYSATITANSGYTLSSVKVTMGGTNITSSAVSGNKISIASVTGDVVITATATEIVIPTYTITNNLTNCTNSNSATSIKEGSSYSATITAKSGYTLKSVSATMGGSAVSVTNGVINISSVTGNIVITATAEVAMVNQIKVSTDASGNPYNGGQGWKTGYRLSASGGGESAYTGSEVTGFIPVTRSSIVRIKNIAIVDDNYHVLCGYDSNKTKLTTSNAVKLVDVFKDAPVNGVYASWSLNSYGHTATDAIKYIRICSSDINANSIITVNQEIV